MISNWTRLPTQIKPPWAHKISLLFYRPGFYKALAIDPNFELALYSKGVALDNLGKYKEAITYYDKALAIDPNDEDVLHDKGVAVENLNHR